MRRILLLTAFVAVLTSSVALAKASFPDVIALPNGWQPEGIAMGKGTTFYVGSIPTGAIYRGDLRTGKGSTLVTGAAGRAAVGVAHDRGRLFVAGGPTGKGFVYDARSGALVRELQLATGGGSDVRQRRGRHQARRIFHGLEPCRSLPPRALEERRSRGGGAGSPAHRRLPARLRLQPERHRRNPDGKTLVVVQSATGKLFSVAAATGVTKEVASAARRCRTATGCCCTAGRSTSSRTS
jgi:outer membrane protein assembly factor BamB